jgi:hypothetical protein
MNVIHRAVSIHPYFNVRPGQMAAGKALLREFVARTAREEQVLYYEFTLNGDQIFCREAYVGAAGLLAHLTNVGEVLERFLGVADLARLEVHGPAEELEQLKGPLGHLNPTWFTYECGVTPAAGA